MAHELNDIEPSLYEVFGIRPPERSVLRGRKQSLLIPIVAALPVPALQFEDDSNEIEVVQDVSHGPAGTRTSIADRLAALEPLARMGKRLDVRLLSLTEAARRLGIKRGENIDYLVKTKQLKLTHIKNRKRARVATSEIERLMRDGFTLPRR